MSPTDVFACENNTLVFHQDETFFLAFGEILNASFVLARFSFIYHLC